MTLDGVFTFNGSRQAVWDLLQDPSVLAKTLPGTERLDLAGPDQFRGVMKVSVGPVTAARFDVVVTLAEKAPVERFVMQIEGKGALGHTRGTAVVELSEPSAGQTTMKYSSNVLVGGTIAAVGQRMLESVGKTMLNQALQSLDRELRARLGSPERP
jgi:carbon monoxide dehydrogenase subunit G